MSHTRTNLVHDADWEQLGRFGQFAKERDISELQLAFSWLAAQPGVSSVIAGATRPEQIRENAEAVCWVPPTQEDREELDEIFPRARRWHSSNPLSHPTHLQASLSHITALNRNALPPR